MESWHRPQMQLMGVGTVGGLQAESHRLVTNGCTDVFAVAGGYMAGALEPGLACRGAAGCGAGGAGCYNWVLCADARYCQYAAVRGQCMKVRKRGEGCNRRALDRAGLSGGGQPSGTKIAWIARAAPKAPRDSFPSFERLQEDAPRLWLEIFSRAVAEIPVKAAIYRYRGHTARTDTYCAQETAPCQPR